jgi:hypothetical protein
LDPPVLEDLLRRRLGGCRMWHEQGGSLCSECHRGKLLGPAREPGMRSLCRHSPRRVRFSLKHLYAHTRVVPGKADNVTPLLKRRLRHTTPSTSGGVWGRAGVPMTCCGEAFCAAFPELIGSNAGTPLKP